MLNLGVNQQLGMIVVDTRKRRTVVSIILYTYIISRIRSQFETFPIMPVSGVLPAFYRRFTGVLPAFYRHSTGVLPEFYLSLTDVLPTFYRRFTGVLPAIYRRFTGVLTAF